jgi:predicted RNase H-like nuclease (RuvC/YqgF family)
MPGRAFYTLPEAAQILEVSQRRLLEMLETGEIEGERDPQSARWKIPKQAADERVSTDQPSEDSTEESPAESAEMIRELVDELGSLHRQVGHLKTRLDRALRTEREERKLLLDELAKEQESHHQERDRAAKLREETNRLRDELENNKGSWRKLFGGQG